MSDIVITDIPYQTAVSGEVTVEPPAEVLHFQNNFGGIIPNTVFCPACSTLTEYNKKWGEIQLKRNPLADDYCFKVGYEMEEGIKFAKCLRCNFDLRNEPPEFELGRKPKTHQSQITVQKRLTADTTIEWISQVKYGNGYFLIPKEEFMRIAKLKLTDITLATSVGGSNYTIDTELFFSQYKEVENNDEVKIGLARNHWRNL